MRRTGEDWAGASGADGRGRRQKFPVGGGGVKGRGGRERAGEKTGVCVFCHSPVVVGRS